MEQDLNDGADIGKANEQTDEATKTAVKKKPPAPVGRKKIVKKAKSAKKKKPNSKTTKVPKDDSDDGEEKKVRTTRPYPVSPFSQVTRLGKAIFDLAGEKIRRLTLMEKLDLKETSSSTRMLIVTSNRYGITKGSYAADYLELTPQGKVIFDPKYTPKQKLQARFDLAIAGIPVFKLLYDEYVNKRLADPVVISDFLKDNDPEIADRSECIDIFVVNVKDLGLLRTIGGAETLISIEHALEEERGDARSALRANDETPTVTTDAGTAIDWDKICFYVSPIGEAGTHPRKHSDLFKSSLIEPAVKELGLKVVRADEIENSGMIATSIIEYIRKSKLVVADLSLLNPNVFYEIGLRHACRLPIVQVIRKADKLPFDLNQVKTAIIDDSDNYTFVPKIETYRAEIAALARQAIANPESVSNPITVFYPDFWA